MSLTHLTDYLDKHARDIPAKPAIVFEGRHLTWKELAQQVEKAGDYFSSVLGNEEQQIVDILLTNSPEFIITYLGVLRAGHIGLPLDPAYKKMELDAIIDQVPPRIIVTDERYAGQISAHSAKRLMVDDLLKTTATAGPLLRKPVRRQIASLFFTSGTTGTPKVVPNTHANHIWNIRACSRIWDWTESDTLLLNLPLSHMHGLVIGLSGMLYHGNTLYLRQQSFDAKAILEDLSSGNISMFTHAPVAYARMLEVAGDYDLSRVRVMISGSAPFPPTLWQAFKERFGVEVVETYGSSETGRIAGNHLDSKVLGSPGPPMPGVKVKLSESNELLVQSPGLFPGYYQNPEATAASMTPDGFWRTGDAAEIVDGNIFLKGRLQEGIRKFSYTISPRDVEWAMLKNPRIKAIQVLGWPRPGESDDAIIYFVVGDISEQQIKDYCKENLLFAWRPDRIIKLRDIPRTRNGKPKLTRLRELAGVKS